MISFNSGAALAVLAFMLPLASPAVAFLTPSTKLAPLLSLKGVAGLAPASNRVQAVGMCLPKDKGEDPAEAFKFLNQNILFPSNYNENVINNENAGVPEFETEEDADGTRETVVNVPSNGESVPVAQIRTKMAMVFTCNVCETRQMKQFSKLAYENGIVILKCSGCDKRHLIADNLGWYKDWLGKGNSNIEELLGDRGEETRRVSGKAAESLYQEWSDPATTKESPGELRG